MGDVVSLVEKAQEQFDEKQARELRKKMARDQYTLWDFYQQIQQIKKMGNIKDLAGMIPGMGKALKDVDIDNDKAFKTTEAIILSMTQKEREHHSKAAIMIGGASAIFYVIWVLASLVFTQHWSSPIIYARMGVFLLAFAILELYMVRSYGYLTEKKAGSNWLMVPASKAEKFVSMLLMVCIVIPLLFFVVYMVLDGFLSLVDPTYGEALFTGFTGAYGKLLEGLTITRSS